MADDEMWGIPPPPVICENNRVKDREENILSACELAARMGILIVGYRSLLRYSDKKSQGK